MKATVRSHPLTAAAVLILLVSSCRTVYDPYMSAGADGYKVSWSKWLSEHDS